MTTAITDPDLARAPTPDPAVQRWLEREHGLLIDDREVSNPAQLESLDPATARPLTHVACASPADVDRAVAAARASFEDRRWRGLHPDVQSARLLEAARLIDEHAAELAELETLDVGKPIDQSRADIAVCAGIFRYYAGWTTKLHGTTNPTGADRISLTVREPHGVCAGIVPWNFPAIMAALKIAPAVATGNSVVLKPAEQTPLTALRLGELCAAAGIPAGVVNIVPGTGPVAGQALVDHPDVDHVSFTGSTEVGQSVMAARAARVSPVALELGGKSATIVFPDADLDTAVPGVGRGIWTNAGQWCVAGTRLLVHRSIADEVVDRLVGHSRDLRLGHGLDPATDIGPLVSATQRDRVLRYVEIGAAEGGQAVLGGHSCQGDGYFVEPTILTGLPPDARVAQEEIFGPVLVVLTFADEAEAIAIANATRFGLAAGVWTSDLGRAHRVAGGLKAGMVWVNTYGEFDYSTSYGGYDQSGYGRELGPYSLDVYTRTKSMILKIAT